MFFLEAKKQAKKTFFFKNKLRFFIYITIGGILFKAARVSSATPWLRQ